jgi:hypothetical protein
MTDWLNTVLVGGSTLKLKYYVVLDEYNSIRRLP